MKRILLILLLGNIFTIKASGQSLTIRDLLTLANLPSNGVANFMYKNKFRPDFDNPESDSMQVSYVPIIKRRKKVDSLQQRVELYRANDSRYFVLHVSSSDDYLDGERKLIKYGFTYDDTKDITKATSMLFQKGNISVLALKEVKDSVTEYSFQLKEKKVPDSISYAEELLQFDSHEFLASYFGAKNVSKDMYYFSKNELKKCSILFNGTPYQAAFIWKDDINMNGLAYIIISNILPTKTSEQTSIPDKNNSWKFKNGIHQGMSLRDVLRLNEMDFYIYGDKSKLAFMVEPEKTGKIDFKKTAVMFSCRDCYDNKIFDQPEISALDIAKANLPLRVFDVIIYP